VRGSSTRCRLPSVSTVAHPCGERGAWLGGDDARHPAGRRADRRRFAASPGESAEELDISLAGPKGSTTKLSLQRRRLDGSIVTVERSVARERTEEATAVPAAFMLHPQVGYIRLTTFENQKAADDLHAALGRLEGRDMKRLVLDLRDERRRQRRRGSEGAGEFLPKGAIVYTSQTARRPR